MIHDGHVLADHSYDHMYHNSKNSPKNAYMDVEEDMKYFGIMNTYPVLDILWKADMKVIWRYWIFGSKISYFTGY